MTKEEARRIFSGKRRELSDQQVQSYSRAICDRFFEAFHVASWNILHTFIPIEKNKEPDTWLIIRRIWQLYPSVKISIPRVADGQHGELTHSYLLPETRFEKNRWGIPEPIESEPTEVPHIDAVLIPLLAFDSVGQRVGYGKGFYDRFLKTCRQDTYRIGISLFDGIECIEDASSLDQRLHFCITPKQMIQFTPKAPAD